MTNIFGLHTQPGKATRYTIKSMLLRGGGGGGKEKKPKKSATSEIRTCDLEIKSLTHLHSATKLTRNQTLATNKAENRCYSISDATVKFPNK